MYKMIHNSYQNGKRIDTSNHCDLTVLAYHHYRRVRIKLLAGNQLLLMDLRRSLKILFIPAPLNLIGGVFRENP